MSDTAPAAADVPLSCGLQWIWATHTIPPEVKILSVVKILRDMKMSPIDLVTTLLVPRDTGILDGGYGRKDATEAGFEREERDALWSRYRSITPRKDRRRRAKRTGNESRSKYELFQVHVEELDSGRVHLQGARSQQDIAKKQGKCYPQVVQNANLAERL
ncbi:hypothetical protein B0H13DRAFT_1851144 [Mycena leptocephala]|nr:hypothetical protein B0H13DRAFT_1851144 [Mycena leptocephala]